MKRIILLLIVLVMIPVSAVVEATSDLLSSGFQRIHLSADQRLPVYSAPTAESWRGADGKAMLNTSGKVWAAGWENGWLLVYYELTAGENVGGVRVGYVDGSKISGSVEINTILSFDNTPCQVSTACSLTDDPLRNHAPITTLEEGKDVIYLCTTASPDGTVWDYIETNHQDQTIRGFIPTGNLKTVDAVKETVPDESMLRWHVSDANISISLPEEYYVFMLDDSDPRLNFSSEEVEERFRTLLTNNGLCLYAFPAVNAPSITIKAKDYFLDMTLLTEDLLDQLIQGRAAISPEYEMTPYISNGIPYIQMVKAEDGESVKSSATYYTALKGKEYFILIELADDIENVNYEWVHKIIDSVEFEDD